ncbi:MAG TPA: cation diffusion facilitator family transporter [Halothiobacillus sp.]|nr:cation diffusion facilitator family transporter [Halothiobacillus sp.]
MSLQSSSAHGPQSAHEHESSTQHDHDDHDHEHHDHTHDHGHHHHHELPTHIGRAFFLGTTVNILFVFIEAGFGFWGNSVALLADAAHNLSDVMGLLIAWGASILGQRAISSRFTYGLGSSTILAALINAAFLILMTLLVMVEAVPRLLHPESVNGDVVIGVALVGVLINGFTAWLFMRGQAEDLNQRGAYLHMAADAVVSLGVAIAGGIMLFTHWTWLDPAVSVVISLVILIPTWHLLTQATRLALHGVPESINTHAVAEYLQGLPEVTNVHDLHIWALSTTENALTVHLIIRDGHMSNARRHDIEQTLRQQFKIGHSTLQIEIDNNDPVCPRAQGCALPKQSV